MIFLDKTLIGVVAAFLPSRVCQSPDKPLGRQREVLEEEIVENGSERRADVLVITEPLGLVLKEVGLALVHHGPASFGCGIFRVVLGMAFDQVHADGERVLAPLDDAAALRQRTHVVCAHVELALAGSSVAQQHAVHDGEQLLHHGVQMQIVQALAKLRVLHAVHGLAPDLLGCVDATDQAESDVVVVDPIWAVLAALLNWQRTRCNLQRFK